MLSVLHSAFSLPEQPSGILGAEFGNEHDIEESDTMKPTTAVILAIALSLTTLLCGCQAATVATPTTAATKGLSEAAILAAGTLSLEGTEQAVTQEQAAELVFLWSAYRSLSQSDTTAAAELTAVVHQISGQMTAEQAKAIDELSLSSDDVQALVAKYGATATSSTSSSDGGDRSSTMRTAAGNMGPGGPEGGMPAMEMEAPNAGAANMGEMGGQTTATDSSAPVSVAQGDSGSVMILVQALVTLLEARV